MKKILTHNDFSEYFNKTDSIVAATIAQDKVEKFLKELIKDPTNGAVGEFPEGYRAAFKDILNQLGDK